jgi:hypothetical protein
MEERKLKIIFGKSGSGSYTSRLTIPTSWIKEMGLTQEEREVTAKYEDGKIIIEKIYLK